MLCSFPVCYAILPCKLYISTAGWQRCFQVDRKLLFTGRFALMFNLSQVVIMALKLANF